MKSKLYKLTDQNTGVISHVIAEEVKEHIAKTTEDVQPEPLRLEAGKSYVNRRGEVFGPLVKIKNNTYPFAFGGETYRETGHVYSSGREDPDDLIREHVPSEPAKTVTETFGVPLGKDGPKLEPVPAKPLPPVRPESVPYEGDEWIFAGKGPLPLEDGKDNQDIAGLWPRNNYWVYSPGWSGDSASMLYALRRGSAIHRAQPWFSESQLVGEKGEESLCKRCGQSLSDHLNQPVCPVLSTYPPAESEWPEKPDAGEGNRENYIQVMMTCAIPTTHKTGESIQTVEDYIRKNPNFAAGYMKDVSCELLPSAVPGQYRELGEDEVIQEGDEFRTGLTWHPCKEAIGGRVKDYPPFKFRRRIQAPEPVVEADPWRDMLPEEVIEEGDEINHNGNGDSYIEVSTGLLDRTVADAVSAVSWRKFRTRRPLLTKPEFPPVGSRLRFTKAGFYEGIGKLDERVIVPYVSKDFFQTNTPHGGYYEFYQNWRDGLELVTVDPVVEAIKIITRHINPPIPIRSFDWEATREGYEPLDPIGYGETPELAIKSLKDREEEIADDSPAVDPVSGVTVPPELLPLPVAPEGKKWVARGRGFGWDGRKAIAAHGPYTGWDVFNGVTSHGVPGNWFILELVDEAPADERKAREWTLTRHAPECTPTVEGPPLEVGKPVRVVEILTGKEPS